MVPLVSDVESIPKVDLKDEAVVIFHGLPESVNGCSPTCSTVHPYLTLS